MDHKLESDGVHCPICGKVLVWRKLASFYEEWEPEVGECPDQCTLAAKPGAPCQECAPGSVSIEFNCPQCGGTGWDIEEYGGYSPDEIEHMRQLADGDA